MIETKGGDKGKDPGGKKNKNTKKEGKYGYICPLQRHRNISALSWYIKPFAAELEKAEQHKNSSPVQKMVENGNQGLTADEIMQKKREEFFSKRMVTTTVKTRFSKMYSSKEILTLQF